jgi:molecular chaperone Hsp33
MSDRLIRGFFTGQDIRFAVCQAADLCSEGVQRHQPDPLAAWLLSEALTCATLLSLDLKHAEKMTLRWMYEGPVGQILADTTEEAEVRGFTQRLNLLEQAGSLAEALGKDGRVAATTSLPTRVLHTGISPAAFLDVPQDLAHLLSLSFQVESAMAVGLIMPPREPIALQSAVGILVQPLPGAELTGFESLRRRVDKPEFRAWLEDSPPALEAVLDHLGSPYEVLSETRPRFFCHCSREKVERVLRMYEPAELREMLEQDGRVEVRCHFCAEPYVFDAAAIQTILSQSESGHA